MSINWNSIRAFGTSQNDGFEELVCQLAKQEPILSKLKFIRNGKPDSGVECFWVLDNQDEYGWQAKYFTSSLGDSQWGQLDASVRNVLAKHPNLKKYYIVIPVDPPDSRLEGKSSMRDKWDVHVTKWVRWASKQGMTVEFDAWWSSDLIERLQRKENVGLTYFWFHKEEFTDEWFEEQTEFAIADLGRRYTQELNVELEIAQVFNGLARDKKFEKQIETNFDTLLVKGKCVIPKDQIAGISSATLKSKFSSLEKLYEQTNWNGIEAIPIEEFIQLIREIEDIVDAILDFYQNEEAKNPTNSDGYRYYHKYGYQISQIYDFNACSEEVRDFLGSITVRLAEYPFLLLEGEAGVGKSHLFADIIKKRTSNGLWSLFFLGQHFVTEEDPWTQILRKGDIHCSIDEFLGALDTKAQLSGHRILVFIDAVNEGKGKLFWRTNLNSFLLRIKKYRWLGLALSIRSTYTESIFPLDEVKDDKLLRYTHLGFQKNEHEALCLFCGYYGIELPSVPLLHPEFQNPLLLKLICEGLHKANLTRFPDGFYGITMILDFLLKSVNKVLSQPCRLGYPSAFNLVSEAIDELIELKLATHLEYIPYKRALIILNQLSAKYGIKSCLLDELVSEGILSQNLFLTTDNRFEEGIEVSYERFSDHLIANYLLKRSKNFHESFSPNGDLFVYVGTEAKCRIHQGLIEAFSIQIPEKIGMEFYEYVPHVKDSYPVVESFVKSLLWRKHETITEKLLNYINERVLQNHMLRNSFWDVILSIASIPNNFLNANFLHRNFWKHSMADRDSWWTLNLNEIYYNGTSVKRLIDWAWSLNDKDYLGNEAVKLYSVTLSWFLVSTNRKIRDSATKALICLLENRIQVLIELLKQFEDVNDPYIYERLYAVAYGCAIRTKQKELLINLSSYIYSTIFNAQDEIYPNILLRDYARGVIEYTSYCGVGLPFDISPIRPPYKSIWPTRFPSNEEIDSKYWLDYNAPDFKNHYWAQNAILSSMTTEYGRKTGGYGDFGRYVFQSTLDYWDVDVDKLSNLAIEWIFERYGYDKDKHGIFDRKEVTESTRRSRRLERIGKKYQWIAFHEILARVSDNCSLFAVSGRYKKDTEPYQGPWMPYVRDIDPTMLLKKIGFIDEEVHPSFWWWKENYNNWDPNHRDWLNVDSDLPNLAELINLKDNASKGWLILAGEPEWTEPKGMGVDRWSNPFKRLWYLIESFLIPEMNFEDFKNWVISQEFDRSWVPDSSRRYEVFSREYYWSSAYAYFQKDYYCGNESHEIFDYSRQKKICDVMSTVNKFLWESEYDQSKEETIRFFKPSKHLFDKMGLVFSRNEGEFLNKHGELICFDPSVNNDSLSFLLVEKDAFLKYLQENRIRLLWVVYGEKNIMCGSSSPPAYYGRRDIAGVYYLNNSNEIEGIQFSKMNQ